MDALGYLFDIIPAFQPLDMQTARVGDYVCLKYWDRCTVVLCKGAGTAGDDPVLTFQQAQDVAGTAVKSLAVVTYRYQKQHATDLTAEGAWTKVTQIASETVTLNATSAEEVGMYLFEIGTHELDLANGFDCLRVAVASVGSNAQLGCLEYILSGPRFPAAPANLLSSIVD